MNAIVEVPWVRRVATVLGASVLFLATAMPANAEDCNETANGGTVTGTFSAYHNVVKWNLKITDSSSDGDCVYIEVQPVLANHTDPEFHSAQACGVGNSKTYSGEKTYTNNLDGVRIKICNTQGVPDDCDEVDYNAND